LEEKIKTPQGVFIFIEYQLIKVCDLLNLKIEDFINKDK